MWLETETYYEVEFWLCCVGSHLAVEFDMTEAA
jgi:hypothetical protein